MKLGGKAGEFYEVKQGLKEGERVVASANFLIDAESKVQGAPQVTLTPLMMRQASTAQPEGKP